MGTLKHAIKELTETKISILWVTLIGSSGALINASIQTEQKSQQSLI